MKKLIMIIIAICLISISAYGNAASPYENPRSNSVFFNDDTGIVLSEEWIKFTIDEDNRNARVDVVYNLINEDRENLELEIMFLAPYFDYSTNEIYEESFKIEVDGVEIRDFEIKETDEIPENWHARYSFETTEPVDGRELKKGSKFNQSISKGGPVKGIQFAIDIEKGSNKQLSMSYASDGGYYSYDDVVNDVFTQLYYLTPARFWNGDPVVNLEIEFPDKGYKVYSNIELEKMSATKYTAKLENLPDEEWTFNYVDTTGLFYGTNRRIVHNIITWSIIVLTAIVGLRLRKRKKLLGTLVILGIIVELFLFRPTYGMMFMIFYGGPLLVFIGLAVTFVVFITRYFKRKRETHL